MHQRTSKIVQDELDASDNLEAYFSNKGEDLLNAAKSKKFSNYCQLAIENPKLNVTDLGNYNKIIIFLKNNRFSMITNPHTRLKNKLAGVVLIFGDRALVSIANISCKKV